MKTLIALAIALNLNIADSMDINEALRCDTTKANIKKIKKIAAALKYAGLHLNIRLHSLEEYKQYDSMWLTLWIESNTIETSSKEYTLYGFEHDLDSLA